MLIASLLTFLGNSLYAVDMLPPLWRTNTLINPVVYLISGFRWSFFNSDVSVGDSFRTALAFMMLCLATVWWIFKTEYRLKAEPKRASHLLIDQEPTSLSKVLRDSIADVDESSENQFPIEAPPLVGPTSP
jgi:cbb3-type cytochrome oxidase subunit 3